MTAAQALLAGLTAAQHEAATRPGPWLVLASAGTGKTRTMTAAAVHRIAVRGIPPARLLAVTLINETAADMAAHWLDSDARQPRRAAHHSGGGDGCAARRRDAAMSEDTPRDEAPGFPIEAYDARRCDICKAQWPAFGFGPQLPVRTTIWACFTHQAEVGRLVRDGRLRASSDAGAQRA